MAKNFAFVCRVVGLVGAIVLAAMALWAELHGQDSVRLAVLSLLSLFGGMGPTFAMSKD